MVFRLKITKGGKATPAAFTQDITVTRVFSLAVTEHGLALTFATTLRLVAPNGNPISSQLYICIGGLYLKMLAYQNINQAHFGQWP